MRPLPVLSALCLAAVVALTGCGGSSSKGTATVSTTAQAASGELPAYQPSTLVSQAAGSTVRRSHDSVAKVADFYADVLAKGGWNAISASSSSFSANFTARRDRDHQGTTIAISSVPGSGSLISVSTYRV